MADAPLPADDRTDAAAPEHAGSAAVRARKGAEPPISAARVWWMGLIGAAALRANHLTWRRDTTEVPRLLAHAAAGPILVVFWHGKFLPLFSLLAGNPVVIFSSLSFRGAVIAAVSRRFGHDSVMLPHFGGPRSVAMIRKALRGGRHGALAIDGPLGPAKVVKPGVVELAARLGIPIVPVSTAASRYRVLADRWDQREVPRPFAHVTMTVGEPILTPADADAETLAAARRALRASLEALGQRAAGRVRGARASTAA